MIKTHGSPTDLQNGAVSAIVGSWNDEARLDFQMHIARQFQNGGLDPHFFQHRNRTFRGPWLLRTWRRHLRSQLCCSWGIPLTRSLLNFRCCFGRSTSPSIFSGSSNINKWKLFEGYHIDYTERMMQSGMLNYVPFFRIPLSDLWFILLFQATYLMHVRGFLKSRLPDQTAMPIPTIPFLRYFGCWQTNTDQITQQRTSGPHPPFQSCVENCIWILALQSHFHECTSENAWQSPTDAGL